jgi:ketosteroid isomerase-like protein
MENKRVENKLGTRQPHAKSPMNSSTGGATRALHWSPPEGSLVIEERPAMRNPLGLRYGGEGLMRKVFAVPLLSILIVTSVNAQGTGGTKADGIEETRQQILKSEDLQNQALLKNDADLLGSMCADEVAWTNASGVLFNKAQMLADLRSGKQKNETIEHQDIRLHVYGTTVVVTGLSTSTYRYNGKTFVGSRRFTNVWIKQGGKWMLVVHHVSQIAGS